jgi:hypothetical protein
MLGNCGDKPRKYRNGVGLAIPEKKQVEPLRRAARYLLAVDKVETKKTQYKLTKDQLQQLKERRQTEQGVAEGALRSLYPEVWLPRMDGGQLDVEEVEWKGRAPQATGVHERVMELLTSVGKPRVHTTVTPQKIVDRVKLGQQAEPGQPPRLGIRVSDVVESFYCFLEPPRLTAAAAIQKAIARGVGDSVFGYVSGAVPTLGPDGKYQVNRERVALGRTLADDEVDLDSGFLIVPAAIPAPTPPPVPQPAGTPGGATPIPGSPEAGTPQPQLQPGAGTLGGQAPAPAAQGPKRMVEIRFEATRDQVFKAFPAIANLADKADGGKVTIEVVGNSQQGFDPAWLRNAVDEPLDEADIQRFDT